MCLIAVEYWSQTNDGKDSSTDDVSPSLLLVSNRDEVYSRPSRSAHFWDDQIHDDDDDDNGFRHRRPQDMKLSNGYIGNNGNDNEKSTRRSTRPRVYGGKDELLGGSWLAVSSNGRLATVTNYHNLKERGMTWPRSRGDIVSSFVGGKQQPQQHRQTTTSAMMTKQPDDHSYPYWSDCTAVEFCEQFLIPHRNEFAGYSALLFDGQTLVSVSNRIDDDNLNNKNNAFYRVLQPGVYGLSNHLLDTPWPKTLKAKKSVTNAKQNLLNIQQQQHNDRRQNGLPDSMIEQLLADFQDKVTVDDDTLLPTALTVEEERIRSSLFVRDPTNTWGTRTTSIVYIDGRDDVCHFVEKNHCHHQQKQGHSPPLPKEELHAHVHVSTTKQTILLQRK